MTAPQPPQPFTRRYPTDAHYSTDALSLAQAGWRVLSVQREPTGAIVATYAPVAAPATTPLNAPSTVTNNARHGLDMRWLIGGVIGGVVTLALLAGIVSALASPLASHSASAISAAATATASAAAADSFDATATAFASVPTPTTAAPTPTPTTAQQFDAIAQTHCAFVGSVTSRWDAAHATIYVTTSVRPQWDISALHVTVENIVFDCFKGFYTAPSARAVQSVDVTVNGPITDAYGNTTIGVYGEADLERATARPFNWANLDYQQAWNNGVYDSQWERNT
jgi:hypothetical protein